MKTPVPFYDQLRGVDGSRPAHQTPPTHWRLFENADISRDGITAPPLLVKRINFTPKIAGEATLIGSGQNPYKRCFLAGEGIWKLEGGTISEVNLWYQTDLGGSSGTVQVPQHSQGFFIERPDWVLYDGKLYLTYLGAQAGVYVITDFGRTLNEGSFQPENTNLFPSARYIDVFYDHLVVGYSKFESAVKPYRVRWSNLRNFAEWGVEQRSEADYYDLTSSTNDLYPGITALHSIAERVVIMTSSSINYMDYTGLPRIVHVKEHQNEIGCDFPFSSLKVNGAIFYLSEYWKNFYMWSPSGVEPIGTQVIDQLLDELQDSRFRYSSLFGYHNIQQDSLVWQYRAASGDTREVFFNYQTREWGFRTVGYDLVAPRGDILISRRVAQLSGTVNSSLAGTNAELADPAYANSFTPQGFLVTGDGLYITKANADALSVSGTILSQITTANPLVLETGDLPFDNPFVIKELESMGVDCDFNRTEADLFIQVSARMAVAESVDWGDKYQLKTPQPNLDQTLVSFPRRRGRWFRFRFELKPKPGKTISSFDWKGFVPLVIMTKAER